jgi:nitrile hydratase
MPAYIRGKTGVVVSESPAYPFPDAAAHGVAAEDEPTYDVRFSGAELWPTAADAAFVHAAVFQSYLERA